MRTLISVESEWLLLDRLFERRRHGDGQIAGHLFRAHSAGGKRKYIRRLVLAAKLAVELADGCVGGQLHVDFAAQAHGFLSQGEKARQRACLGDFFILVRDRDRQYLRRSSARRGVRVQIWVQKDHRARGRAVRGPGSPSILRYVSISAARMRIGRIIRIDSGSCRNPCAA